MKGQCKPVKHFLFSHISNLDEKAEKIF